MIARLVGPKLWAAVCVSVVVYLGAVIPSAAAVAEPDPGLAGPVYEPGAMVAIDLTLPEASIEALGEEPTEYQPGTFSLAATDGTPDGVGEASAPLSVGVRLKGKVGSFRPLSRKAAFKVKFNELVKGQKFLGLKRMTLNNMVQDPSMIHETLAYETFRAAGVPAPRTGYAFVRLNGEPYGVYLNVETVDETALKRWFGAFESPPQHLYEGEYGTDVTPGGAGAFEVDEGDGEDRSDLETLIAAVATEGEPFSARVSGLADLEEMTRMWSVERYIGHWDGYAGMQDPRVPNNFQLYSEASGKFQMLPWGTDQTWNRRLPFDGEAGVLFDHCLTDAACAALYREALIGTGQAVEARDLDSLARASVALLAPWQELAAPREEHDLEEIGAAVGAAHEFIADRPGELAEWLHPSKPAESPAGLPLVVAAPQPQPLRAMRLDDLAIGDGVLVTRLRLPEPGALNQRATIRTADGRIGVCATRAQATGMGGVTLRCELSTAARRRLRKRWLRLDVRTTFAPAAGRSETLARGVLAPRDPTI
jgi:hypothetical protein